MSTESETQDKAAGGRINWDDPNVPAGNSPPLPGWPLWVSVAAWSGWMVFLAVTAVGG